jgi:hypothetical protein
MGPLDLERSRARSGPHYLYVVVVRMYEYIESTRSDRTLISLSILGTWECFIKSLTAQSVLFVL